MPDVLNVARYIVRHYKETLAATKLEKLVYYCRGWSLALLKKALFPEDMEAWLNGPVCPKLFDMHRHQYEISKSFLDQPRYNRDVFNVGQKIVMNDVIKYYGQKNSWYLSQLTRKELPWIIARQDVPIDKPSRNRISKASMIKYYSSKVA